MFTLINNYFITVDMSLDFCTNELKTKTPVVTAKNG